MIQGWQAVWGADRKVMDEAEPQRPFSDAYASGMPTKKRKVKQVCFVHTHSYSRV